MSTTHTEEPVVFTTTPTLLLIVVLKTIIKWVVVGKEGGIAAVHQCLLIDRLKSMPPYR